MSPALATPSPAIILSDDLLGANDRSFFVLRTILLHPPTYYAGTERQEFVEISVWDGTIRSRCLIRETSFIRDAAADDPNWERTERTGADCNLTARLTSAGAGMVEPLSMGPLTRELKLDSDGVHHRVVESDKWIRIIDRDYIKSRARLITRFDPAEAPWEVGASNPQTFNIFDPWGDPSPLPEVCKIAPAPREMTSPGWIYLHFICWSGDGDADGANFFIPVSNKTWNREQ